MNETFIEVTPGIYQSEEDVKANEDYDHFRDMEEYDAPEYHGIIEG